MEIRPEKYLQLMYYIESRATSGRVEYFLSLGLRNVSEIMLKHPAVAVDVLVDNFSTTANALDGHQWWARSPEEWQPIGLDRTQKFHTWADHDMVLHAGTERCVISMMPFYCSDDSRGLRSARVEVFVYSSGCNGCAVLELTDRDLINMGQRTQQQESAGITGVVELERIDYVRYAAAPVAEVMSDTAVLGFGSNKS